METENITTLEDYFAEREGGGSIDAGMSNLFYEMVTDYSFELVVNDDGVEQRWYLRDELNECWTRAVSEYADSLGH